MRDFDAVVGLAYPSMSSYGMPIFDSMIQQNLLTRNMFSFYMSVNDTDQSQLLFGGYDPSLYVGIMNWHPVIE